MLDYLQPALLIVGTLTSVYLTLTTVSSLFPVLLEFTQTVPVITTAVNATLGTLESTEACTLERPSSKTHTPQNIKSAQRPNHIQCWCPSTGTYLGEVKAMTTSEVDVAIKCAKAAQIAWSTTSYSQRRMVLRTIQQYILANIPLLTLVCTRDSGKPRVDALLGEIMTTCEKIRCINSNGEGWLDKQYR